MELLRRGVAGLARRTVLRIGGIARYAGARLARVRAVLAALWTAIRRDAKSIGSFASNNFFLVSVIFLALKDPGAFVSLNFLIGMVLFFPLSTDPLRKVPRVRLAIWPLAPREHRLLRIL